MKIQSNDLKVTESYKGTWALKTGKPGTAHKTVGVDSVGPARGKSGNSRKKK